MGLLPMGADILPPSDDRVFKLILTSPEAKQGLMNLISSIIGRTVVDVVLLPNELAPGDTEEKAERFDVNCKIDDGSQINLEMQASHMIEDLDGQHRNLKGKSVYYLTDLHSSQPAKGLRRYDRLARSYQITFCSYTIFPNTQDYMNSFSLRHDTTGELLSDAISLTFVELSKLSEVVKKPVCDMTDLDKWSVFLQYAPDLEHREIVNKVIESEEVLQVAGDLLMNISKNERERAIYRSRRKFQTDLQSDLATAEDRGRRQSAFTIAKNLLSMDMPREQVAAATGLTLKDLESILP
ncbi:MAG: Rpn family recombination-promoting nuclease/putative transposase [Oscillospiraceae bacterium]|nr:Rpn family recombination-promoting nuclease/putative transposase [Oscillospiraceae bacterium]